MLKGFSCCFHRSVIVCNLLLILSITTHAQFIDDFTDADFTNNPAWAGSDANFTINVNQLRLQAPATADVAFLSSPSTSINNASWKFFVKLTFNPSGANYTRVYLTSDSADLTTALNGYFVMIGDTPDEVSLYRQSGSTRTKIINGTDGRVNFSTVSVVVKVTRDALGTWELFSDVGSTGIYISEGIVHDTTHLSSDYFGVFCNYTSTRSDKFYFDDFIVTGDPFADVIPPQLQSVQVISANKLDLVFSELLDATFASDINNYLATNGIGNPSTATLQPDQKTIRLNFNQDFPNGIQCTLTSFGVKDVDGNEMMSTDKTFLFFQPVPVYFKDIIITEIFADPSPQVGLPEVEFVEIFNRSKNPIDLLNWKFTDGSSTGSLSACIVFPGEYLILTPTSSANLFTTFGKTEGVSNFPTLNNSGDALVLKDANGVTIDSVNYSDGWYKDTDKKEGGWSLELIDPENSCGEHDNWVAAEDANGGTPGKQNSVFANKPDLTGPMLLSAIPTSANTLWVKFSEKLEKGSSAPGNFITNPSVMIQSAAFDDLSLTTMTLSLKENLQGGVLYTVQAQNIYDCPGNVVQNEFNKIDFALPESADSLDIVVNEILFNPRPTGVDFVEVYNKSEKFINLKNWSIANMEDSVANEKIITRENFLLRPRAFLVFTTDANILKGEYISAREENFFAGNLPSLNDDEGTVAIVNDQRHVVDYFRYSKGLHSIFIKDEEGVSLERISVDQPSNDSHNWKSASSIVGFATPGYMNSNSKSDTSIPEESINVDPEIFIPQTGQPDFTLIRFNFDQGGYVANVKIIDTQGHEIKQLANNEVLGINGFFRWDGDREDGSKVRVGYYLVWFEVFDAKGTVKKFRKRVVVATKF